MGNFGYLIPIGIIVLLGLLLLVPGSYPASPKEEDK